MIILRITHAKITPNSVEPIWYDEGITSITKEHYATKQSAILPAASATNNTTRNTTNDAIGTTTHTTT